MDKNDIIYCLKYIHAICLLPCVASDARRRRAPLLVYFIYLQVENVLLNIVSLSSVLLNQMYLPL